MQVYLHGKTRLFGITGPQLNIVIEAFQSFFIGSQLEAPKSILSVGTFGKRSRLWRKYLSKALLQKEILSGEGPWHFHKKSSSSHA